MRPGSQHSGRSPHEHYTILLQTPTPPMLSVHIASRCPPLSALCTHSLLLADSLLYVSNFTPPFFSSTSVAGLKFLRKTILQLVGIWKGKATAPTLLLSSIKRRIPGVKIITLSIYKLHSARCVLPLHFHKFRNIPASIQYMDLK